MGVLGVYLGDLIGGLFRGPGVVLVGGVLGRRLMGGPKG